MDNGTAKARNRAGHTLIEVMLALAIAAIFMTAFITVYFYGIREFNRISSEHQMLSEGQVVLESIEKAIRMAKVLELSGNVDPSKRKLTITYPDVKDDETSGGDVEYYYNSSDKTLRKNDRRIGQNDIFIQVLPIPTAQRTRRFGRQQNPFNVVEVSFRFADSLAYPSANAGYIVAINLVMEDDLRYYRDEEGRLQGNRVKLSSCMTKLN